MFDEIVSDVVIWLMVMKVWGKAHRSKVLDILSIKPYYGHLNLNRMDKEEIARLILKDQLDEFGHSK